MTSVALLVNPTAGKGRAARVVAGVVERLRVRGIDVAILIGSDVEHAKSLARTAIDDGVDAVVARLQSDGVEMIGSTPDRIFRLILTQGLAVTAVGLLLVAVVLSAVATG